MVEIAVIVLPLVFVLLCKKAKRSGTKLTFMNDRVAKKGLLGASTSMHKMRDEDEWDLH